MDKQQILREWVESTEDAILALQDFLFALKSWQHNNDSITFKEAFNRLYCQGLGDNWADSCQAGGGLDKLAEAMEKNMPTPGFDSGLGVKGLGRHEEKPIIPTVAQMERREKLEAKATTCRRCGQSDVFDGAMFTTGGAGICDDCF